MNPEELFDPSFQLTFVAVLTIAGLAVPLLGRTTGPLREVADGIGQPGRDPALSPRQAQFRLDVRAISASLGELIGERRGALAGAEADPGGDCAGGAVRALRTDADCDYAADGVVLPPDQRPRAVGQYGGASADGRADAVGDAGGGVLLHCALAGRAAGAGGALGARRAFCWRCTGRAERRRRSTGWRCRRWRRWRRWGSATRWRC